MRGGRSKDNLVPSYFRVDPHGAQTQVIRLAASPCTHLAILQTPLFTFVRQAPSKFKVNFEHTTFQPCSPE